MSSRVVAIVLSVIAIALAAWLIFFAVAEAPITEHATTTPSYECNADAKICPDGTAVGRTGPDCEFAACPAPNATTTTLQTYVGGTVSGLNVKITVLQVTQDSRCPASVQCIWAGTVTIKARIESGMGTSTMDMELGKPITTEAEEITLTAVTPAANADEKIPESSYRFTFEIKRR